MRSAAERPLRWDVWARRGVAVDAGVPLSGRGHSLLRTAGAAPVSSRDPPCDPRSRGLAPPEGTVGKGSSRTWECIIWLGWLICRVVGEAIVLHPRRPVSLKIGP